MIFLSYWLVQAILLDLLELIGLQSENISKFNLHPSQDTPLWVYLTCENPSTLIVLREISFKTQRLTLLEFRVADEII